MADQDEARQGNEETGPYAEAHPDRPNSGEAPVEASVTEEAVQAAERKAYRGGTGATAQGPVTDLDIGDFAESEQALEQRVQELDEQLDRGDEITPMRRGELAAERDYTFRMLEHSRMEAQARSGERQPANDPGDARGQLTEEGVGEAQRGSTQRTAKEGRPDDTRLTEVDAGATEGQSQSYGRERSSEAKVSNAERKTGKDAEKASRRQRDS